MSKAKKRESWLEFRNKEVRRPLKVKGSNLNIKKTNFQPCSFLCHHKVLWLTSHNCVKLGKK